MSGRAQPEVSTADAPVTAAPTTRDIGNRERLPALDLLRFVAATMVLFFHEFETPGSRGRSTARFRGTIGT